MGKIKRIILVCSGNVCRSPMAEGILKSELKKRGWDGIGVSSAGISALEGMPPVEQAVTVCRDEDMDISGHRSRPLKKDMIKRADLILVMEKHQREHILNWVPKAKDKVFLLGGFARGREEMMEIYNPDGPSSIAYIELNLC